MNKITNSDNSVSSNKPPNFLLNPDECIKYMACGPLHSLMLSNKNRLFASGYG